MNITVYYTPSTTATLTVNATVNNTHGGTKTISDFTYKIDSTTVTSGAANSGLSAAAHTVSVTGTTGYTVTIGGNCAADGTITLAASDNKTCTVTLDDIAPTLTVNATVINDNGGTATASTFTYKVDSTTVTSGASNAFNAGLRTVSVTGAAPGYAVTIGGGCASDGTITLSLAQTATCTVTLDDIAPKITVTKVLVTDNGGTEVVSDFPLFVDSTSVTSGVQTTTTIGAHVISETSIPSEYTSIIAGDCDVSGNITLALGDVKSCVITNNDKPAHINVVTEMNNLYGGPKSPSDFTYTVTGNSPSPSTGTDSDEGVSVTINAGSYSVSNASVYGYTASASEDCAGSILPGETKTCTITESDIQPKLTVTKVVINDNGGTKTVTDFPLFVGDESVTSGEQNGFYAGTYTVSETGDPSHYSESFGGVGGDEEEEYDNDCSSDGSITLHVGDVRTCTIVNDDIAPKLKVIKQVVNDNGGTTQADDFTLKVNTQTVTNGNDNALNVGDYIVGEIEDINYSHSFSGDCDLSNGNIHLELGETKTCIITNNDRPGTNSNGPDRSSANGEGDVNSGHSGHGTTRLFAAVDSIVGGSGVPPGGFGGGVDGPITFEEKVIICAVQKAGVNSDDSNSDEATMELVGQYLATLLGRTNSDKVVAALKDPAFCAPAAAYVAPAPKPIAVRLNKDGIVVSSNPVWNACVAGKPVSQGLLEHNLDTVFYRRGHVHKEIAMTCRDYHTGDVAVWSHPDFQGLYLTLDSKGHLKGGIQQGYIAVRDKAGPSVADQGANVANK